MVSLVTVLHNEKCGKMFMCVWNEMFGRNQFHCSIIIYQTKEIETAWKNDSYLNAK